MIQMPTAATAQAIEEGKKRLREFLEESQGGKQAIAMRAGEGKDDVRLGRLNGAGREVEEEVDEI